MASPLKTPVRLREGGWEYRCDRCARLRKSARFWPLTVEFWDAKQGMNQCRACHNEVKAAYNRSRYQRSPGMQRMRKEQSKAHWQLVKSDPVALQVARERGREATRRYRERQKVAA